LSRNQFYYGLLPPPTSLDLVPQTLKTSRSNYQALRQRYLIAPDGRWANDCSPPDLSEKLPVIAGPSKHPSGEGWDPLSLDGSSPWKTWFSHLELRGTIKQDVERTFPDIPYFEDEEVRRRSITLLFFFAVLNPDVGYRQVCLWVGIA
jgi:TBC1 domain family protein 5